MSYAKLFKVVPDFPLGFQTLNQANDNGEAILDAFDLRHGSPQLANGNRSTPLEYPGHHDDPRIARTVADFRVDAQLLELVPLVSGPIFGTLFVTRLGVGQWRIYVSTPALFAAVALMKSTTSVDYRATCYIAYATNGPCVTVSTWNVATPAREDLDFSLILWAQRAR